MATGTLDHESIPKKTMVTASTIETTADPAENTTPASGPRILHVGRSGLTFTHVLDSDNSTYLYILDTNHAQVKSAPELTIKSARTSKVVGTIQGYDNAVSHDLVCRDKTGALVASWEGSSALMGGENLFRMEPGVEGELLEEVLISGLAMVEHRAKRNRHGFGGAVAAGVRMAAYPFRGSSK
ncbi:MAG: hypothetical protein Q9219_002898 [cf. Caloplaca sp. 3 TL-2023]